MRKRKMLTYLLIALLVLFTPVPHGTYKDGGTKDWISLTYRIVKWNRLLEYGSVYQRTRVYWFPDNFRFLGNLWEIEAETSDSLFNIRYELGSAADDFLTMPPVAVPGDTVEIRTVVLTDADIHVYVDGKEIGKTHDDSDYWGYTFDMSEKDVEVTARYYTKDEIWGMNADEFAVLRKKYPEYFDLPKEDGLEIYVWQMSPEHYSFGLLPATDHEKTFEELLDLTFKGVSTEEMRIILSSYGVDETEVTIIPWQNPVSSYLGEYWIQQKDEAPESLEKRRQEYIDHVREMLFASRENAD